MLISILKTAVWPAAIAAAIALSTASFVTGYFMGYTAAWQDAIRQSAVVVQASR